MESAIRDVTAPGTEIAGLWIVERPLAEVGGLPAVLARGVDSGRAILFLLPADAPAPALDEHEAARWGTVRRVLRDEQHGRVVVDEVPEGALLSERLALGMKPAQGLVEELARRVREMHRAGGVHGQLSPDRIVIGPEGAAVAGWGLGAEDTEKRKGRDLAWISRLTGLAAPAVRAAATETSPTGAVTSASPDESGPTEVQATGPVESGRSTHRLQAAILSSHRPTLRTALAEWNDEGGSPDDPAARRAVDALARLDKKIGASLAEARQRLAQGDPLGAVAPCREAIRLGAEAEADPLLRQARRQARQLVKGKELPSPRFLAMAAGATAGVLLIALCAWLLLRTDPRSVRLQDDLARVVASGGERAAVLFLLDRRDAGTDPRTIEALLAEHLPRVAEQERTRLAKLHRESVSQGASPREADRLADEALGRVADLKRGNLEGPTLRRRLQQALLDVDRAAMLYRSATSIGTTEAARAVERMLLADPVFTAAGDAR